MRKNLTHKILEEHLVSGHIASGNDISIKIDQVLLQDATGTMAMLEFEALGVDSVRVEKGAQYVDHNLIQTDHKNADDHRYLLTATARYGLHYSPPGNGISHQVHMERLGVPGKTMLGSDSHTPSAAGISMLAMGAGGLDVALAMAGSPYHLPCPRVLGVKLTGELPDWVSARDIILEMLRRHGVKGCLGKIVEYHGSGVLSLSATDRATIGNMGAELGATTSIFPSDKRTAEYLAAQGRGDEYQELRADDQAQYDEEDEIDLSSLEPLIACPSSPGNVVPVREKAGLKVGQVIVGSCSNSSFRDLMTTARIVAGRHRDIFTEFNINPGSKQVLANVVKHGAIESLLLAGARIHEPGCLGCIGMGQAPGTDQVSLRTFPRNFPGRSGTREDRVYLCSPETAAAAALKGVVTDPRDLGPEMKYPRVKDPENYFVDDSSLVYPSEDRRNTRVERGPNIKPLPSMDPLPETLTAEVGLLLGDNITTDDIMPAGNKVLPLRSNIEAISEFVFAAVDRGFVDRAKNSASPLVIVAGENYGQGSSREHAALAPRYLGVRVKIAKSFARIHKANLCNFGILPLTLENQDDYGLFSQGDRIVLPDIKNLVEGGEKRVPVQLGDRTIFTILEVSDRQRKQIAAGGALNLAKIELAGS